MSNKPVFHISETYEELAIILEKQFGCDKEKAKLIVDALTYTPVKDGKESEPYQPESLWQLDSEAGYYQGPLGDSRYNISFTRAGLDIVKDSVVSLLESATGEEGLPGKHKLALICLKNLIKCAHYINDVEYCVYYNMVHYLRNNNVRRIGVDECMPLCGDERGEKTCAHLDKEWRCPFRCGISSENCSLVKEKAQVVLYNLEKDGIVVKNGEKYELVI